MGMLNTFVFIGTASSVKRIGQCSMTQEPVTITNGAQIKQRGSIEARVEPVDHLGLAGSYSVKIFWARLNTWLPGSLSRQYVTTPSHLPSRSACMHICSHCA